MRSLLTFLIVPILSLLLLTCLPSKPKQLPSDEVLRRTMLHTALLESVDIDATATMHVLSTQRPVSATLVLTGTLFPLRSAYSVTIGGTVRSGDRSAEGTVLLLAPSLQKTFLRVEVLRTSKDHASLLLSGLPLHEWLQSASGETLPLSDRDHIPDPRLIELAASAVSIDSVSLDREADGSFAYRLAVHRDREDAGHIEGNLLIDAFTFRLLKADWTLTQVPSGLGDSDVRIEIQFHDENRTSPSIPVLTGSVLPLQSIFDMISSY